MDYRDCTLADDAALAPGDDSQALYGDGSICVPSFFTDDDSLTDQLSCPWAHHPSSTWAPRCQTPFGAVVSNFTDTLLGVKPARDAIYDDPLESVRQHRRFGTDRPETWDPMFVSDCAEVLLFSADPSAACHVTAGQAECAEVLAKTFKSCFGPETSSSLPGLLEAIADGCNYEVLSITRLQNLARYSMHKHFGQSYGIASVRQVYHGTARANARTIAKVGFRNAASQRAKFGKGIYAAKSVWEALAYAEPAAQSNVQTFLVADLFQGPTRVGHENMADFGLDPEDKQILTTTNPEQTIFCAAYEDQLYAHYSVSVRFMLERTLWPTAYNLVRLYHPSIWRLLKAQPDKPPSVKKPVFAVPLAATPPKAARVRELEVHMGFRKGDTVTVVQTLKPFTFCRGAFGRIANIVKDGHVHFCVELDDPALQERLKLSNKAGYQWQTDLAMMRCRISHIQKVAAPPTPTAAAQVDSAAAADAALLLSISVPTARGGKRKRD